ncbi:hypothetical protein SDC9_193772 [bioreactor metagenome]|uniref:Uncharacterized protein n=1 Tax=bioreactor metagenome TaxID=1076179 RepID=A0A645I728_9ZZZZ
MIRVCEQARPAPGIPIVIFSASAECARELLSIHINLLITFTPPTLQRMLDRQRDSHEMPAPCRFQQRVIEAHQVGLMPPAGIKVECVLGPLSSWRPLHLQFNRRRRLKQVLQLELGGFFERHREELVSMPFLAPGWNRPILRGLEVESEERPERSMDLRPVRPIPDPCKNHFAPRITLR